jgi:Kef-type K+ transport system membrane component KefB
MQPETAEVAETIIRAIPHHAVLILLLQIAILLLVARLLGEVMRKLKQPAVVGELAAGVLLGPSIFGALLPELQGAVFPKSQHQSDLLGVVSWIGVLFLLVVTGLETDLGLIKRRGKAALTVSAGGIVVPFASGVALGWFLPERYLADPSHRLVFALFMAVAMSISAVPVIAKVLMDLKLMRRDIGQLIMASAMTDDTIGWILLSVVAGLVTAGKVSLISVGESIGGAALVLTFAFTIGTPIVARIISAADKFSGGVNTQVSVILVLAMGAAAGTHHLGIEAVLGAFIVGILVAQAPRFRKDAGHALEIVTASFLAPIFFASAGLKVDLLRLADKEVFVVGIIVLGIACAGKFIGAYIGAAAAGISHWERLALGSGMNARGAMEIVVATVGLALGVLTIEMYSIVVMIAIVTSMMAPPLLRWTLSRVRIDADEAKRLEMEEIAANSFVRTVRRVLFVTRMASQGRIGAQIVGYMSHEQQIETLAVYARPPAVKRRWWRPFAPRWRRFAALGRQGADDLRRALAVSGGASRPDVLVMSEHDAPELILVEAAKGYDMVVVCDAQRSSRIGTTFGNLADEILRRSPVPTMVIKAPGAPVGGPRPYEVWRPRKIMVPTVGTEYSKNAVEVASVLAASTNATLLLVHVAREHGDTDASGSGSFATDIGHEIVSRHAERGRKFGATIETRVLTTTREPDEELLRFVRTEEIDLVLIGSGLRIAGARAFFGHRVERMLRRAPCAVAIVSST